MPHSHEFFTKMARILNLGKSRSVFLCGNVYDLFYDGQAWVPIIDFLGNKCVLKPKDGIRGVAVVTYEANKPIRITGDADHIKDTWNRWKNVTTANKKDDFDRLADLAMENPTFAMEFLRQMTIMSRERKLSHDLLLIIGSAEMVVPIGEFAHLSWPDRQRIAIFQSWFADPKFQSGHDSVVLLTESRSLIHPMIAKLPQVVSVDVPAPNLQDRKLFSVMFCGQPRFADMTAGITLQAYRQLLCDGDKLDTTAVIAKVEEFICSQLGEDVVEFKRPTLTLADVVGFSRLKRIIKEELIPRFQASREEALVGAAIAGPIGSGKTYLMEAMASELGMPVVVLKNLRSKWFGETDIIFERLRRVLDALDKVCIFMDEADTQFGGLGTDTHETERRLTGKVQAMMSDPRLKGKVIWLLMTARIERLSADIRRPGRVGDLIIPVLDPDGNDRVEFLQWVLSPMLEKSTIKFTPEHICIMVKQLEAVATGFSAAEFTALRSQIKVSKCSTMQEVLRIASDNIPSDIGNQRRYQILQALLNCTRRSLLPDQYQQGNLAEYRDSWRSEIEVLERKGIK